MTKKKKRKKKPREGNAQMRHRMIDLGKFGDAEGEPDEVDHGEDEGKPRQAWMQVLVLVLPERRMWSAASAERAGISSPKPGT